MTMALKRPSKRKLWAQMPYAGNLGSSELRQTRSLPRPAQLRSNVLWYPNHKGVNLEKVTGKSELGVDHRTDEA